MKIQKSKKCGILPFVTKFEVSFEVNTTVLCITSFSRVTRLTYTCGRLLSPFHSNSSAQATTVLGMQLSVNNAFPGTRGLAQRPGSSQHQATWQDSSRNREFCALLFARSMWVLWYYFPLTARRSPHLAPLRSSCKYIALFIHQIQLQTIPSLFKECITLSGG